MQALYTALWKHPITKHISFADLPSSSLALLKHNTWTSTTYIHTLIRSIIINCWTQHISPFNDDSSPQYNVNKSEGRSIIGSCSLYRPSKFFMEHLFSWLTNWNFRVHQIFKYYVYCKEDLKERRNFWFGLPAWSVWCLYIWTLMKSKISIGRSRKKMLMIIISTCTLLNKTIKSSSWLLTQIGHRVQFTTSLHT